MTGSPCATGTSSASPSRASRSSSIFPGPHGRFRAQPSHLFTLPNRATACCLPAICGYGGNPGTTGRGRILPGLRARCWPWPTTAARPRGYINLRLFVWMVPASRATRAAAFRPLGVILEAPFNSVSPTSLPLPGISPADLAGQQPVRTRARAMSLINAPIPHPGGRISTASTPTVSFARQLAALNEKLATVHVFPGANHFGTSSATGPGANDRRLSGRDRARCCKDCRHCRAGGRRAATLEHRPPPRKKRGTWGPHERPPPCASSTIACCPSLPTSTRRGAWLTARLGAFIPWPRKAAIPFGTKKNACVYFPGRRHLPGASLAIADTAEIATARARGAMCSLERDALYRQTQGEDRAFRRSSSRARTRRADHRTPLRAGRGIFGRADAELFSRSLRGCQRRFRQPRRSKLAFAAVTERGRGPISSPASGLGQPKVDRYRRSSGTTMARFAIKAIIAGGRPAWRKGRGFRQPRLPDAARHDRGHGQSAGLEPQVPWHCPWRGATLTRTEQLFSDRAINHSRSGNRILVPPAPGQGVQLVFEEA